MNMTLEQQLEFVRQNPENIKYLENPAEEVQLEAMNGDPTVISLIDNPTAGAILQAIKSKKTVTVYPKSKIAEETNTPLGPSDI